MLNLTQDNADVGLPSPCRDTDELHMQRCSLSGRHLGAMPFTLSPTLQTSGRVSEQQRIPSELDSL